MSEDAVKRWVCDVYYNRAGSYHKEPLGTREFESPDDADAYAKGIATGGIKIFGALQFPVEVWISVRWGPA